MKNIFDNSNNLISVVPDPDNEYGNSLEFIHDIEGQMSEDITKMVKKYASMGFQVPLPAILCAMCSISLEQLAASANIPNDDEQVKKVQKILHDTMNERSDNDFISELMGCYAHLGGLTANWYRNMDRK